MIVPDINMLIYAHKPDAPEHDVAQRWWQDLVHGTESVGIPWAVATGFVRVISIPGVLSPPVSPANAADSVAGWFRHDHITPINPGDGHMRIFQENLAVAGSGTKLVTDAHIAALTIEHDAELHTNDSDFARFPGLRWLNPLA